MLTVYSEEHALHDARAELYGGVLVPPFDSPARAEHIIARVREVGLGEVIGPDEFVIDAICRIHDREFIRFLQTCWEEWSSAGFDGEAIAASWPARGMRQDRVPRDIEGKLGYCACG